MEVGPGGQVAWQQGLPTDPRQAGIGVQPLVLGGTGVFTEENAVYALRLATGGSCGGRSSRNAVSSTRGTCTACGSGTAA
jgi:hypothetical protein